MSPARAPFRTLVGASLVAAAALLSAATATAAASLPPVAPASAAAVPPGFDPFYRRYVDAGGIPVIASARVPDRALLLARDIVGDLLRSRPDLRRDLVGRGVRVAVIAEEEGIADLPEHRDWRKPRRDDPRLTQCELKTYDQIARVSDRDYWNARARGIGGTLTAVGAENLLGTPGGRYFGENILVHEFSHQILSSIERVDPALYAAVERAYAAAGKAGRWKGDYAAVTIQEYWAEGTQYWFNTNMLARLDDGAIVSDADLRAYDRPLAAALARAYGDRHRILADVFYRHPARLDVPLGYKSAEC